MKKMFFLSREMFLSSIIQIVCLHIKYSRSKIFYFWSLNYLFFHTHTWLALVWHFLTQLPSSNNRCCISDTSVDRILPLVIHQCLGRHVIGKPQEMWKKEHIYTEGRVFKEWSIRLPEKSLPTSASETDGLITDNSAVLSLFQI